MTYLGQGCQAVGGTRGVGHHVVLVWVVLVLIYAHYKHGGCTAKQTSQQQRCACDSLDALKAVNAFGSHRSTLTVACDAFETGQ